MFVAMREFFKPTKFKIIFSVGVSVLMFFSLSIGNHSFGLDDDGVVGKVLWPVIYVSYILAWYLGSLPNILQIPIFIIGVYVLACLLDFIYNIYKSIKSLIVKP